MYGLVNKAIQDMVCDRFGEETWKEIKQKAEVAEDVFISMEGYPDDLTHKLVKAASDDYTNDLMQLVQLYQQFSSHPVPAIENYIQKIELDFLIDDLPKVINSIKVGAERISEIVLSLRNFSRLDEAEMKKVDIHEGLDSTLLILQNRFKQKVDFPGIEVVKNYGNVPLVDCYVGQLNQVFMNIISNAIDALEDYKKRYFSEFKTNYLQITITT